MSDDQESPPKFEKHSLGPPIEKTLFIYLSCLSRYKCVYNIYYYAHE